MCLEHLKAMTITSIFKSILLLSVLSVGLAQRYGLLYCPISFQGMKQNYWCSFPVLIWGGTSKSTLIWTDQRQGPSVLNHTVMAQRTLKARSDPWLSKLSTTTRGSVRDHSSRRLIAGNTTRDVIGNTWKLKFYILTTFLLPFLSLCPPSRSFIPPSFAKEVLNLFCERDLGWDLLWASGVSNGGGSQSIPLCLMMAIQGVIAQGAFSSNGTKLPLSSIHLLVDSTIFGFV